MPTVAPSPRIYVLMFHSISDGAGATCMAPSVFSQQLKALADCGYHVGSLSDLNAWLRGAAAPPERSAVVTFDDAFADFASEAAPRLAAFGYRGAVFTPTGYVGAASRWDGEPARPLLTWDQMRALAAEGFEFGSHAVSHRDLTTLTPQALTEELALSRQTLERELGRPAPVFAAPFGKVNDRVRFAISTHYDMALGVRLGVAHPGSDRFDVPRIEMHYFRDAAVWRRFLEGNAEAYFAARRIARSIRAMRWGA